MPGHSLPGLRWQPASDGLYHATHPVWRPDGALAFQCSCGHGSQVVLLEPGMEPRPLTSVMSRNVFPSFSGDGRRVAFVSDRDGNFEIYLIYN